MAGLLLWFGGWELFKRAFWLWVLFGLIWPLTFLINPISVPLRRLMTILTAAVLSVIEGPDNIIRKGTTIMSAPDSAEGLAAGDRFNLGIAAACSGLRFPLCPEHGEPALRLPRPEQGLAPLHPPPLGPAVLAVIGNFVRMMMLYFGTIWFGSEFAIGKGEKDPSAYHIGAGIMVFIVALFCMMGLVTFLKGGFKALRRKKTVVRKVESEVAS